MNPHPALTFLPRGASRLSKQGDSAPAGAAIVSWPVPLSNLWSAEAGGQGSGSSATGKQTAIAHSPRSAVQMTRACGLSARLTDSGYRGVQMPWSQGSSGRGSGTKWRVLSIPSI